MTFFKMMEFKLATVINASAMIGTWNLLGLALVSTPGIVDWAAVGGRGQRRQRVCDERAFQTVACRPCAGLCKRGENSLSGKRYGS